MTRALLWVLCAPLLSVATATLTVLAVTRRDDALVCLLLSLLAACTFAFRVRLSFPGARARLLSGNSPFGCFHAPSTVQEFAQALCGVWCATGHRPTVVGSGWGFLIGRQSAQRAVFTHRLKGKCGQYRFLAGTELKTVEEALFMSDAKTFWSTPTMQRISIGSWLGRSCHGNGGESGQPSSYAASRVLIVDLTTRDTAETGPRWERYENMKSMFDESPGQFVIAAVEFDPSKMSENLLLKKTRCDVERSDTTCDPLRDWLDSESILRVLFFGWARRRAIGINYVKFDAEKHKMVKRRLCWCGPSVDHVDPHDCSASCTALQLDTCSLVGGWLEEKRAWGGVIRLRDANKFSPDPSWLVFPLISLVSGTVNFELIFVLVQTLTSDRAAKELRVQQLCNSLFDVYTKVWGRSELRMGSLSRGLVFVDFILREADVREIVLCIAPHVHGNEVALHDSKFCGQSLVRAISSVGLQRKTPRGLFGA